MSPLSTSSSEARASVASGPAPGPAAATAATGPYGLAARLLVFLLPVLASLGASETVLALADETRTMESLHALAATPHQPTLFKRALLAEELRRYKWSEAKARQPEILALGSSTVMQIRAAVFGPLADRAYNGGGLIHEAVHLREVAERLDALPHLRLLVLGLDPWWWKSHLPPSRDPSLAAIETDTQAALSWRAHLRAARRLVQLLAKRPSALRYAWRDGDDGYVGVGLKGREGSGFRSTDGSYRYGDFLRGQASGDFSPDVARYTDRAARCEGFFVCDPAPSPSRVQALVDLLDAARDRGVLVVGYLPPMHPTLVDALLASPVHAGYLRQVRAQLSALFAARDLPWLDALDVRPRGFQGDAFYDGLHASETVLAALLAELLDDPRVAQAVPGLSGRAAAALVAAERATPGSLHLPTD